MYSRYHKPSEHPVQLPENYSGVAFFESNLSKSDSDPPRTLEVAKPSPLPPPLIPSPEQSHQEPKASQQSSDPKKPSIDNNSLHRAAHLLPKSIDGFPFSHGIGFEELFIIALIILLSKNEQSSEMVLWLTLLLFCG